MSEMTLKVTLSQLFRILRALVLRLVISVTLAHRHEISFYRYSDSTTCKIINQNSSNDSASEDETTPYSKSNERVWYSNISNKNADCSSDL